MRSEVLESAVGKFAGKTIAVIGDLMLDVYIWGKTNRISPEAPVPVVEVAKVNSCLGGAANVMRNIVTLGGRVKPFGVIGNDADGREILRLIESYGIDGSTIVSEPTRRTTQKQRIIAGTQQLLRIDYEQIEPVKDETCSRIIAQVIELIKSKEVDAVIFEDYAKGLLSEKMLNAIIPVAQAHGVITTLDPKPGNLLPIKGLTVMKPNRAEAFALCGMYSHDKNCQVKDDQELMNVAAKLMTDWAPEQLLISLSAQGMALFRKDREMVVIPTRAREVFDVSGAGDTVISAYTLALSSQSEPEIAAEIANYAAGIVVGKIGTVTVGKDELIKSFSQES